MSKYDTVCYLGFTIKHNTEEPNVLENVGAIRLSALSKIASMTD